MPRRTLSCVYGGHDQLRRASEAIASAISASLQDGKKHWDARENAFAVALDEVRSRGPDSNDEVGRFVRIESVEIIHEWAVCFVSDWYVEHFIPKMRHVLGREPALADYLPVTAAPYYLQKSLHRGQPASGGPTQTAR